MGRLLALGRTSLGDLWRLSGPKRCSPRLHLWGCIGRSDGILHCNTLDLRRNLFMVLSLGEKVKDIELWGLPWGSVCRVENSQQVVIHGSDEEISEKEEDEDDNDGEDEMMMKKTLMKKTIMMKMKMMMMMEMK